MRVLDRIKNLSPRTILLGALSVFWIYCWPGFVGWDTREHLLQSRAGVYTDGHPAAVARLVRICELFIAGPLLVMLIQSVTVIIGLYMILKHRCSPRRAAWLSAVIFLFPFVAGVNGLITKDALMAGALLIGIGFLLDGRKRWALVFLFAACLMRWNAPFATFAPIMLLFQWGDTRRFKRYAIAFVVWLGIGAAAYETNELLTSQREYFWYWSTAYQDIAGTMEYMPPIDDATALDMMKGLPLRVHDRIQERFHEKYDPAYFYQYMRNTGKLLEIPRNDTEREAVAVAWKRFVFGYPWAYLRYRVDNFKRLTAIDHGGETYSNVYVWFHVLAADETVAELQHDAAASHIQQKLIDASVWISLTPLYFSFIYLAISLALLPFVRRHLLDVALLLSGIGYELAYFILAQTPDVRYSQWMVICTLMVLALAGSRFRPAAPAAAR